MSGTQILLSARLSTCMFLLPSSEVILARQLFSRCSSRRSGRTCRLSMRSMRLQLRLRQRSFQQSLRALMARMLLLVSSILKMRALSYSPVDYTIASLYIFKILQISSKQGGKKRGLWMAYNIMLRNSLLIAIILASALLIVEGFNIRLGLASELLHHLGLEQLGDLSQSEHFLVKAFIFPYQVYEMQTKGSSLPAAKSYIFAKIDYSLLAAGFQLQTHPLRLAQYQKLYHQIPETIYFQGENNEDLELIHQDPSLLDNHFIIKNSTTTSNGKEGRNYDLNFYSLQLTKFLEKKLKTAQKELNNALEKEDRKVFDNSKENNKTQRSQLTLTSFLGNQTNVYPNQLLHSETNIPRVITDETLWTVQYDAFSLYFASAAIKKNASDPNGEPILDLYIMVYRKGEDKRTQHIKQPIKYLNLTTIQHLDLCFSNQRLKLLLADSNKLYLIDITTHLWNLDTFKINAGFSSLHFDGQCQILKVGSQLVAEVNGLQRIKYDHDITTSYSLKNFLIFCQQGNICSVHLKSNSKLVLYITLPHNFTDIKWQEYYQLNGSQVIHWISYRQRWNTTRYQQKVESFDTITNTSSSMSSIFYDLIYPYEIYLNKQKLRSKQMNKLFYHHLETIPTATRKNYQIPHNYYQFNQLLQSNNNCTSGVFDQNQNKITINSQDKWSVCTLSFPTSALIQLKIVIDDQQVKMYVCEAPLQNQSTNPEINCEAYVSTQSEKSNYLPSNHLIRFYILRTATQHKFPTFYFKDIERQQLAFASTIFFYLMLLLSVSFFVIILFIIIKPAIIALMIYYGWRHDHVAPTYPLTWFQLKIKIKKLVQWKFLRYIPHEPTNEDQDNHCCFCLQNLAKETMIAQLYCQHQFHKQCFNEWIKNQPNLRCPTCRRQFTFQHLNDYLSSQQIQP